MIALAALLALAVQAKPSPEQLAWQDAEVGMFVHFAPNTWQDQEYDGLSTPLDKINPAQLDTDQWARTAKNMGARYLVFVAKHVGGFCWWQTNTTEYSVKNTPWRNGKGDVMADVAKSCRKYGLKLGVYLSPQDRKHGVEVGGKTKDPIQQAAYIKVFRQQLTELLTKYGPIFEVWFDGSLTFDVSDISRLMPPTRSCFRALRRIFVGLVTKRVLRRIRAGTARSSTQRPGERSRPQTELRTGIVGSPARWIAGCATLGSGTLITRAR